MATKLTAKRLERLASLQGKGWSAKRIATAMNLSPQAVAGYMAANTKRNAASSKPSTRSKTTTARRVSRNTVSKAQIKHALTVIESALQQL